jgi:ABC-type Na+ transport system ATPase subunit NatA
METLSFTKAYNLLKKYKYVVFDGDTGKLSVELNDERDLIVRIKINKFNDNVILFPSHKNTEVNVTNNSVCLVDANNWNQIFYPLEEAQLSM